MLAGQNQGVKKFFLTAVILWKNRSTLLPRRNASGTISTRSYHFVIAI